MPNGTTGFFRIGIAELLQLVQAVPDDSLIAEGGGLSDREYVPVTAGRLRELLRDYTWERVVVSHETPSQYVVRLVPPLVFVPKESPLFEPMEQRHPGGLYMFDRTEFAQIAAGLNDESVIGKLLTKEAAWSHEELTARALVDLLHRHEEDSVLVIEQEHSWYVLHHFPRTAPGVPARFVSVPRASPLVPLLRRFDENRGRGYG